MYKKGDDTQTTRLTPSNNVSKSIPIQIKIMILSNKTTSYTYSNEILIHVIGFQTATISSPTGRPLAD